MEQLQVHDIKCEVSVLGVLISYPDAYDESTDILSKDVFYKPENQELYQIIKQLHDNGDKVDIIGVAAYVNQHPNKNCQLELSYLTECASSVVSSANFREHCLRLHDLYERRQLWLIGQKLINAGTSEIIDTVTLKQDVISAIQSLDDTPHASIVSVSDALKQLNEIVNNNMSGEQSRGIPTGFSYLDDRGGLCRGDLVVIAAEFSQGKTSLALDLSTSAARNNYPVAFYSTEMTNPQLSARIISAGSDGKIRANDIIHKALTQEQLNVFDKAVGRIESLPIFFDDTSTMSIERIISSIRMLVRKKGINLVCIDFLQVLQTNEKSMRQNEEQFYGMVTRKLKNLAKELNIAIVLLSQISRSKDNTTEPTLNRVRGSGQISEAADVILLIYRPELYKTKYSGEYSRVDPKGTALIKLAKGRNIGTGSFICGYDAKTTHFYELGTIPTINKNSTKREEEEDSDRPF